MLDLIKIRENINEIFLKYYIAKQQYKTEKENLKKLKKEKKRIEKAQVIIQTIAQEVQEKVHLKIIGIVSRCLETVFGNDYAFRINFNRKRGRTEAKLILLKNGNEIEDALNEDSGGVVEIASFALRLACLLLSKPVLRRILILDEPFKNISLENLNKIKKLLEGLSEDFKIQFIIVTHIEMLQIGKVIKL